MIVSIWKVTVADQEPEVFRLRGSKDIKMARWSYKQAHGKPPRGTKFELLAVYTDFPTLEKRRAK